MNNSNTRVDAFRVAGLVALGLEFARSHGVEYAQALMEQMGAGEDAITLMLKQYSQQSNVHAKEAPCCLFTPFSVR